MSSDWWDDFFNNLATDLAPLISLFGESPTKQFLSESVSPIDIFIFAMAPLGIITAMVSALRVGGTPSLRAFIGYAQEGGGNIEAELCSSTSRDVCEMYNNGGIARVFGRPKILEIVHDPHADTEDFYGPEEKENSAGIYSFKEYIKSGKGDKGWRNATTIHDIVPLSKTLWQKRSKILCDLETAVKNTYDHLKSQRTRRELTHSPNKAVSDTLWSYWRNLHEEVESAGSLKDTVPDSDFAPHPNLSLNVGIKKRSRKCFFLAAALGLFLQSGVLVFAGLSVFTFGKRFQKNDKPADAYAFPFTLAGTLLLCTGVGMCGHIVERSTKERIFRRKSTIQENDSGCRFFWIQPGNQVIGDQVFDPFAYNRTLDKYTTSSGNTQNKLRRSNNVLVWVFVPVTVFGYILQFIGLRALHSTVSIAQLGATILMSIIRSTLRTERLRKEDNLLGDNPDLFQGHELDWLAIGLYKDKLREELTVRQTETQPNHSIFIWQVASCPTHPRTTLVFDEQEYAYSDKKMTIIVSVSSNDPNTVLLSGFRSVPKSDHDCLSDEMLPPSTCGDKKIHQWLAEKQQKDSTGVPRLVPRIFLSRGRIARMTGVDSRRGSSRGDNSQWAEDVVPARKLATALADALRRTADVLFSKYITPPVLKDGWANASTIFLALDCSVAKLSTSDEAMHHLENPQSDVVYITLSRTVTDQGKIDGQWNSDASEIEAILSLWMWSLRIRACGPAKTSDSSASPSKMNPERLKSTRLLFVKEAETDGATRSNIALLQSILSPWLADLGTKVCRARLSYPATSGFDPTWVWARTADVMNQTGYQTTYTPMSLYQLQNYRLTDSNEWLIGWSLFDRHPPSQQQSHCNSGALVTRTDHSPAIMCAQEIYTNLFRNLITILEDIGGETKVMRGRHGFYLANDNITEIIRAFTNSGLGSEEDARACIIPALLERERLPVVNVIAEARDTGDEYRKESAWAKAKEVLQWAFDKSLELWKSCQPDPEEQACEISTTLGTLESTIRPNDPSRELWLCVVALCECYRWALFSEDKSRDHRLFGVRGINTLLDLSKALPYKALIDLAEILEVYGKLALRVAKENLNVAAAHELSQELEQKLEKYEALSKIRNADSSPEEYVNTFEEDDSESSLAGEYLIDDDQPKLEASDGNVISAIKAEDMSAALYHLRGPSAIEEDEDKRSSLSWAAQKGWFIVVRSLVELGAIARQSDIHQRTPLHYAAFSGDKYLVTYLLEQGIDVNSQDKHRFTPLFKAAQFGRNEIVEILLRKGANVNATGNYRTTPLILATRNSNIGAVRLLLRGGANPAYDGYHSPLASAICRNSREMIKLFLEAGVDPDDCVSSRVDFDKDTESATPSCSFSDYMPFFQTSHVPLDIAILLGLTDVIKELLTYGADPELIKWDYLPKDLKDSEILSLVLQFVLPYA